MARLALRHGDEGTNGLVSDVIRTNELQAWFVAEPILDAPVVRAASRLATLRARW
jgi:starvation-inducible DNA-binding protein